MDRSRGLVPGLVAVAVVGVVVAAWLGGGREIPLPVAVVDPALLTFESPSGEPGAQWPRFRGPSGDGVSAEIGLAASWSESPPRELWRVPLGEGYSGISVRGERLFTMFGRDGDEWVGSFDAPTGREAWRLPIDSLYRDGQGNGPRSTPVIDGDLVYALGARGRLFAIDVAAGAVAWSHDLQREYGARLPTWGVATQPLIDGDLLLVNAGGSRGASIIAFDKRTGVEVWRSLSDMAGYAAPVTVEVGGIRQALFFTAEGLVSVAPAAGHLYWRVPWRTTFDVNAAAPVVVPPDMVFISSGYDTGAALYRIAPDAGAAEEVWRSRVLRTTFSGAVYHEGHLYGFDESTLKCVDALTGEMRWRQRGLGHGSLIVADGHLIVLGEAGTLALASATPAGWVEAGRLQVFDRRSWTAPTLAGGRLYLRDERSMVALELTPPPGS